MNRDALEQVLAARHYLYQLCQVTFGVEPSGKSLEAFVSPMTQDAFDLLSSVDPASCAAAKKSWQAQVVSWRKDEEAFLRAAKRDYMRLLIGPGELQAPPWECVYITKERMLLQEQTLRVRQSYRSEGFAASLAPHVSDDHIAIELDFMAKLCEKGRKAFDAGDDAESARLAGVQRAFVEEHLNAWVPDYADDLKKEAPLSLYAAAGALCAALLHIDSLILEELEQAEEPDDGTAA